MYQEWYPQQLRMGDVFQQPRPAKLLSYSISTLCQSSHKMLTFAVLIAWMKSILIQSYVTWHLQPIKSSCLSSLDVNKASGPDEIPARTLKETAREIDPSLCDLFNKLLRLGSLPTEWKLAAIVPVYKKDNKEYIENYRPISLLCLVSKVMERSLFNVIEDQLYILVGSCQHGFMAKRSCVTQLVEVYCLIGSQLDKRGQVDFMFLDISKAFDKVSHASQTTHIVARTRFWRELTGMVWFLPSKPSSEGNRISCVFRGTPCNFLSAPRFNLRPYAVSLLCEFVAWRCEIKSSLHLCRWY